MDTVSTVILVLCAIVAVFGICIFIRNIVVYEIRMAILFDDHYSRDECNKNHAMLPSYDQMMLHPSQWFMWTTKHYKKRYVK